MTNSNQPPGHGCSPLQAATFSASRRRLLATMVVVGMATSVGLPSIAAHANDGAAGAKKGPAGKPVAKQSGAAGKIAGPILVVGDSLSAEYGLSRGSGWVELLSQRIAERFPPGLPVVNASISGDTTAGGRARLPGLLQKHQPSIVIIELGGNDALRGLDLKMTEANLRSMLGDARKAGATTLLLGMMLPPNYGKAYGERFSAVFRTAAEAEDSALVPFFLERVADRNDLFQSDRIHPGEQAQPMMLDNVWPTLEPLIRKQVARG